MTFLLSDQIQVCRSDLNHPTVSGNKLYKLQPHIKAAIEQGCKTIVSFGGAYSNHLHALAWACKQQKLNSVGIVRGELHATLTPTLNDCQNWGMTLQAMQRKAYREIQEQLAVSGSAPEQLKKHIPSICDAAYVIAEGGSDPRSIESLRCAYKAILEQPQYSGITHIMCATGTGATVAGLRLAAPAHVQVIGVQAVAEGQATLARIQHWLPNESLANLTIMAGHLGGFAKINGPLLEFIKQFEQDHNIPLDPVYNGKVMFKLSQLMQERFFTARDRVLVIHTGGLQGKRGFDKPNAISHPQ